MKEVYIEESNGLGFIDQGDRNLYFINIFAKYNFKIKWDLMKKNIGKHKKAVKETKWK